MKMTVEEIAKACGGRLLCGNPQTVVTSVTTDSRKTEPGSLFVPIIGERTDAHMFIRAALAGGSAAAFTQENSSMDDEKPWIAVEDTLGALQSVAVYHRKKFDIPVVGITGSVGKTTTKEMVALALSAGLNVMKTRGNLNSQVGLPQTLLELSEEHQAAVIEMGMSNFGEMSRLARIVEPACAVMTNIGISHIGQLKTRENILSEKLHITDRFREDSVLFLNGDDEMLAALRGKVPYKTVFYGTGPDCDFRAEDVKTEGESIFFRYRTPNGEAGQVVLPVPGMHHVSDALAGLAVASHFGIAAANAARALASYRPLAMRQMIYHVNEITVIDDSYNASPDTARSSLQVLSSLRSGRRIAVLADMLELGDYSEQAHFDVGVAAAKAGVDILITVGKRAEAIAEGAHSVNPEMDCHVLPPDNAQAIQILKSIVTAGDAVLIKGSRGMKMEEIVRSLL